MKLSERYDVNSIDGKCDGWNIAKGFDTRLGRPVLVAAMSGHHLDRYSMDAWLARRVSVSHAYVAELFDGLPRDDAFYCVFESRKDDLFGLPDLSRHDLLSAFVKMVSGVEALFDSGVGFRFSERQIIWDGSNPHVLGLLPQAENAPHLSSEQHVEALMQYFSLRLQQRIDASDEPDRILSRSPVLRMGLNRLSGEGTPCTTFSDLRMVLEAMLIEEQRRKVALQAAYGQKENGIATSSSRGLQEPDPIETGTEQEASMETIVFSTKSLKQAQNRRDLDEMVFMPTIAGERQRRPEEDVEENVESTEDLEDLEDDSLHRFSRSRVLLFVLLSLVVAIAILYGIVTFLRGGPFGGAAATNVAVKPGGTTSVSQSLHVTGLTAKAAVQLLAAHGIHSVNLQAVAMKSGVTPGSVIASTPSVLSSTNSTGSVTLQVAVPSGEEMVPNVIHLSLQAAEQKLLADHFHYSYVIQHVAGATPGMVIEQNPAPYGLLTAESNVSFVVAQKS